VTGTKRHVTSRPPKGACVTLRSYVLGYRYKPAVSIFVDQFSFLQVALHFMQALPSCDASALIAGGLDIVSVSRRLGHGSPTITLNTYAHLFAKTDTMAGMPLRESWHRNWHRNSP
jgi:hypothetical protein